MLNGATYSYAEIMGHIVAAVPVGLVAGAVALAVAAVLDRRPPAPDEPDAGRPPAPNRGMTMAHVFDGKPDGRQADEPILTSRFRPRYRALSDAEKDLHDRIKAKAAELELLFDAARDLRLKPVVWLEDTARVAEGGRGHHAGEAGGLDTPGDYFDDGMTALELAVMWTVKGLTS